MEKTKKKVQPKKPSYSVLWRKARIELKKSQNDFNHSENDLKNLRSLYETLEHVFIEYKKESMEYRKSSKKDIERYKKENFYYVNKVSDLQYKIDSMTLDIKNKDIHIKKIQKTFFQCLAAMTLLPIITVIILKIISPST